MTGEIHREEEMSPEYRAMVVQLMESQAYRELAAAHMFGYGLRFVPEKWLKFMVWHIQEEAEHYAVDSRPCAIRRHGDLLGGDHQCPGGDRTPLLR